MTPGPLQVAAFDRLAVIDLETTGLDPATGLILEVGVVIVDPALCEVAHHSVLLADAAAVAWAERARSRETAGADLDVPERMHLASGLVEDILTPDRFLAGEDGPAGRAVTHTSTEAEAAICAFLDAQGITEPLPLAGSSVRSLDGPFLAAHMPTLFFRFTHRTIDASALTEFARFVDPDGHTDIMGAIPSAGHRTIGDCRRSIDILRRFASHYGIGGFNTVI